MITLLLWVHISLAIISLSYAGGVIVASRKQKQEVALGRVKTMWYGTIATMASGVGLTVLSKSPIGPSCMALLSFLVVVLIAHSYQKVVFQKAD